jgi:hypothetical protein
VMDGVWKAGSRNEAAQQALDTVLVGSDDDEQPAVKSVEVFTMYLEENMYFLSELI